MSYFLFESSRQAAKIIIKRPKEVRNLQESPFQSLTKEQLNEREGERKGEKDSFLFFPVPFLTCRCWSRKLPKLQYQLAIMDPIWQEQNCNNQGLYPSISPPLSALISQGIALIFYLHLGPRKKPPFGLEKGEVCELISKTSPAPFPLCSSLYTARINNCIEKQHGNEY